MVPIICAIQESNIFGAHLGLCNSGRTLQTPVSGNILLVLVSWLIFLCFFFNLVSGQAGAQQRTGRCTVDFQEWELWGAPWPLLWLSGCSFVALWYLFRTTWPIMQNSSTCICWISVSSFSFTHYPVYCYSPLIYLWINSYESNFL